MINKNHVMDEKNKKIINKYKCIKRHIRIIKKIKIQAKQNHCDQNLDLY